MKNVLVGLLSGVGLLLTAGFASAQTLSFNVLPQGNAQGSYHVVIQQLTATDWFVQSITANGGAQKPNANADDITLSFYQDAGETTGDNIVSFTGTAGVNGPHTNYGNGSFGPDGYDYDWGGSGSPALSAAGTNSFAFAAGSFIQTAGPVGSIDVLVQDGHHWENSVTITPETASLWLLLAAAIPFAVIALRRRSAAARSGPV